METLNSLTNHISRYSKKENIKKVIVAISGGADSVAVLSLLKAARLDITALHCNFNLRGEESIRDEKFTSGLCHELEVPIIIKQFDVPDFLKKNKGTSLEMACRKLRYDWFYQQLEQLKTDRIVTGHNADDNVETLFLNLLRGSGCKGLKGMQYDTGIIWRPLLSTYRKDILLYLEELKLTYITDSSNLKSDFRRNFLRNEIIPLLRSKWKGFDKAMLRSISNIYSESNLIEGLLNDTLPEDGNTLDVEIIKNFGAPELIIRRFIEPLHPFSTTSSEIIEAIIANKPHIRRWKLKGGEVILRNGKLFLL